MWDRVGGQCLQSSKRDFFAAMQIDAAKAELCEKVSKGS